MEKIEQGTAALSPTEQTVRERLGHEIKQHILAKLDLEAALEALTPKQKACFLLYADGYTYREIAHALSLSLPTVQQHIGSAKARLQKFFLAGA